MCLNKTFVKHSKPILTRFSGNNLKNVLILNTIMLPFLWLFSSLLLFLFLSFNHYVIAIAVIVTVV